MAKNSHAKEGLRWACSLIWFIQNRALKSIAATVLPCCRMEWLRPRDAKDEMFGFERTQALTSHSAHDIAAAAQQFGQEDDITVVKLRHTPIEPSTT